MASNLEVELWIFIRFTNGWLTVVFGYPDLLMFDEKKNSEIGAFLRGGKILNAVQNCTNSALFFFRF